MSEKAVKVIYTAKALNIVFDDFWVIALSHLIHDNKQLLNEARDIYIYFCASQLNTRAIFLDLPVSPP